MSLVIEEQSEMGDYSTDPFMFSQKNSDEIFTNNTLLTNQSFGESNYSSFPKNPSNFTDFLLWFLQTKIIEARNKRPVLYDPPVSIVILLSILYGAICLIALVGNLILLWLVWGSKRMWTVTNMFICNMAVADVIMAIFIIPFQFQAALFQRWDLPHFLCPICPSVQILSVTLSVFTMSAIALHRYRGIMAPLKVPISKRDTTWALLVMWLICTLIALPTAIDYNIVEYQYMGETVIDYCQNT